MSASDNHEPHAPRDILHVDMDAFYASVEQRDRPELAGKAVIVGGTPDGRGVVAAASYEARRYGVASAMPAARAKRLCPHAIFIRSRMDHYAEISTRIREIFARYTPLVEPLSLDEAFLDVTASRKLFGDGPAIARRIKDEIRGELRLVASVGVAPNKFLAKVASDLEKPDGLTVVAPAAVQAFLDPLPVGRVWGVGKVAGARLDAMGVRTVRDLRAVPADVLAERFGRWGQHLHELAHGRDSRRVTPDHEAKSLSHETTFAADVASPDVLRNRLLDLAEQVGRRLRRSGLEARTVEIKVRYADFDTVSRSRSAAPTSLTRDVWRVARALLERQLRDRPDPVRLLGLGVSGLDAGSPRQGDLFADAGSAKARRLDAVADAVAGRYGAAALRRAGGLRRPGEEGGRE